MLTTEYFWHCPHFENFHTTVKGSGGKTYSVTFGPVYGRGVQRDWSCTCQAFKFNVGGKYCKHINAVKDGKEYCGWSQFMDGGDAVKRKGKYCCPECGREAKSMGWGV